MLGDTQKYDVTGSISSGTDEFWPLYLEHALIEDKETVQTWNSDLDSILIFVRHLYHMRIRGFPDV